MIARSLVGELSPNAGDVVVVRGWVHRLRVLKKTTFVVLRDCSGSVQCVAGTASLPSLKLEDVIEVRGRVKTQPQFEIEVESLSLLAAAAPDLPFTSTSDLAAVGMDALLEHRPLAMRHEKAGEVFKVQATILRAFRAFLTKRRFTEIVTSKIVASGTEGGTNLFELKYFGRSAYLAQSPQFYKEHGVCGFERVFETGHVYRAEPHATSRHLTEYFSLDLEMGFIDGPEDVMQLERELLTYVFEEVTRAHATSLSSPLPSLLAAPAWEFGECLERLKTAHGRTDLVDDLDPEAERQLCALAEAEAGVPAVFVVGFPLAARPFYTAPRGASGAAQSFDLLFRGLEITTGGQRLHTRAALESALRARGLDPSSFASHLRMFELGMPPHGGLAIGLERLTAQVLGLANVRDATLYPRDRNRLSP
jgi:nondiscriminating aspartyl-tRNA synthetase